MKRQEGEALSRAGVLEDMLLLATLEPPLPGEMGGAGLTCAGKAAVQPAAAQNGSIDGLTSTGCAKSDHANDSAPPRRENLRDSHTKA
jgi:hypothetical protein